MTFVVIIGVIVALVLIIREIRVAYLVRLAERRMVISVKREFNEQTLAQILEEFERLASERKSPNRTEFEKYLKTVRKVYNTTRHLDRESKKLLDEGLCQPSDIGRNQYYKKIINESITAE